MWIIDSPDLMKNKKTIKMSINKILPTFQNITQITENKLFV